MNSSDYLYVINAKNNWSLIHNRLTDKYLVAFKFNIKSKTYKKFKYDFEELEDAMEFFNNVIIGKG